MPQDHPTGRSLHDRPVARVGGLAIWAGFLPVALLSPAPIAGGPVWLAAWAAVTAVSVADDWRGVRPAGPPRGPRAGGAGGRRRRCCGRMPRHGLSLPLALAIAGTALAIVWAANLFNFMDGNDGLAAVMAICGFGAFGVAAMRAGVRPRRPISRWPRPRSCFSRSTCRRRGRSWATAARSASGFLAAVFGFSGIRAETWPAWFPLLVFLPFVADATVTVVRRLARGDHLFEAHRTHYYQRLHRMGSGHRGTLLFYGVLIVGTSASALFTLAVGAGRGLVGARRVGRRDRRSFCRH